MSDDVLRAQREYAARVTGAFSAGAGKPKRPKEPPPEPVTGVRPKVPPRMPQEAPTRPDAPMPKAPAKSALNGHGGAANGVPAGAPRPAAEAALIQEAIEAVGGGMSVENVRALIARECRELEELLFRKNAGYGNSALEPLRIFSRASPVEQLCVRIDDKLSRIVRGDFSKTPDEQMRDTVRDLQGYLVLLQVAWRLGLR